MGEGLFGHGSYVSIEFKGRAMGSDENGKSDCKAMVKKYRVSLMIDYEGSLHELKCWEVSYTMIFV